MLTFLRMLAWSYGDFINTGKTLQACMILGCGCDSACSVGGVNKKVLTLLVIHQNDKVLLGMKKRGFGMGKWNGFGGKVDKGETVEEATKRELFEEAGISVGVVEKLGVLDFSWSAKPNDILEVNIFKATDFSGQPRETEEMKPQWFEISKIPFEKMWADDTYWFPLFLEGKKFTGKFLFDKSNTILEYQLHEDSNRI